MEQKHNFLTEQKVKLAIKYLEQQHKKEMLELKAELTETKTELLLTQNKLRELKEAENKKDKN